MPLGREIEDPARAAQQTAHVKHRHLARLAGVFIGAKHLWIGLFELQRKAIAHEAHRVDGVHQCIDGGI
mgnify:CR=1 FL=1